MPLLVGLGVDELSVGAARVGAVRGWIRSLRRDECRRAPRTAALTRGSAGRSRCERATGEAGDAAGEASRAHGRVVAVGPEA